MKKNPAKSCVKRSEKSILPVKISSIERNKNKGGCPTIFNEKEKTCPRKPEKSEENVEFRKNYVDVNLLKVTKFPVRN
jgi:hypothetical protein